MLVNSYLDFRIATFNFYKGYCLLGSKRDEAFKKAIDFYEKIPDKFEIKLPKFDSNLKFPGDEDKILVPEIKGQEIKGEELIILAYLCNYIGEPYSKMLQEKKRLLKEEVIGNKLNAKLSDQLINKLIDKLSDKLNSKSNNNLIAELNSELKVKLDAEMIDNLIAKLDDKLIECQKKALFYCAHAYKYMKESNKNNNENSKVLSVYTRNYGCAIQRAYGEFECYDKLKAIYKEAFDLDYTNINNFKVRLDLCDAQINDKFGIKFVEPDKDRNPSFSDILSDIPKRISLDHNNSNYLPELEELNFLSAHTKMLHPTESFGYRYACIYFRDMCIFYLACSANYLDCSSKEKAKTYFDKAEENWETVNMISPYDPNRTAERPMTQVLRNDLDALKKLLK